MKNLKISYNEIKSYSKNDVTFLLTNNGSYYLPHMDSKFKGFFWYNKGRMFRIIAGTLAKSQILEIKNNFYNVEQKRKDMNEVFWLYKNSFILEQDKMTERHVVLDVKESYDNRSWGRNYEISEDQEVVVIKFTKSTSHLEDSTEGVKEFEIFIAITGETMQHKNLQNWVKREYQFDLKRNSPHERYVYEALLLNAKNIVFSVSDNRENAIAEARDILKNIAKVKQEIIKKHQPAATKTIKNKELALAFKTTANALNQLVVNDEGIFAGLPWFFQFWSRDELVSAKALMINGNFGAAKKIIWRHLENIQPDGRLPNQTLPFAPKTNADSIGWLFKRIQDYEEMKGSKGFSQKEKNYIKDRLLYSIKNIKANFMENNLIRNNPLETWMDTEWGNDTRNGFNIEIQAMFMNMLRMAYEMTKDRSFKHQEIDMRIEVKSKFMKDGMLIDNLYDPIVRPNFFIAAYVYPQLLSKDEWSSCFKTSLKKLWLKWGGLSSIDRQHPLFTDHYTGEIPQSYHRGDSWFWINDLGAQVMFKTDKVAFKGYIEKILKADIEEIMTNGITGTHSELSSAKNLESNGCFTQAWSNAMFVELIEEITKQSK